MVRAGQGDATSLIQSHRVPVEPGGELLAAPTAHVEHPRPALLPGHVCPPPVDRHLVTGIAAGHALGPVGRSVGVGRGRRILRVAPRGVELRPGAGHEAGRHRRPVQKDHLVRYRGILPGPVGRQLPAHPDLVGVVAGPAPVPAPDPVPDTGDRGQHRPLQVAHRAGIDPRRPPETSTRHVPPAQPGRGRGDHGLEIGPGRGAGRPRGPMPGEDPPRAVEQQAGVHDGPVVGVASLQSDERLRGGRHL
jgi:hypothetical protein